MNRKLWLFGFVWFALVLGCGKLPLQSSQSVENEEEGMREAEYSYYSTSGEIAYALRHDEDYWYLSLSSTSRPTIAKILQNGLKFCLDTTAKKKQDLYFHFPAPNATEADRRKRMEEMGFGDATGNPMQMPGQNGPREAVFFKGGKTQQLNLDIGNQGFRGRVRMDPSGVLFYAVAVPKKEFSSRPLSSWKKVAFGISIKGMDLQMSSGTNAGSVVSNPNQQMQNRVPGTGFPNQPIGARGAGMSGSTEMNQSVRIWFQLQNPD